MNIWSLKPVCVKGPHECVWESDIHGVSIRQTWRLASKGRLYNGIRYDIEWYRSVGGCISCTGPYTYV